MDLYEHCFAFQLPDDFVAFTSFSMLSVDLLYHKKVIDVVQTTRKQIVNAIAAQFFGCFVQPLQYREAWLVKSLARLAVFLFLTPLPFHTRNTVILLINRELFQIHYHPLY